MGRIRIVSLGLVAVMAVALMGCGDDEAAGDDYASVLRFIPDTPEARQTVIVGDLAALRDTFDVEQPEPGASAEQDGDYLLEVLEGGDVSVQARVVEYFGIGGGRPDYVIDSTAATREGLGFGAADMDRYALVREAEGATPHYVMQGQFVPDDIADALEQCDACPPHEHEEYRDWQTYAWGPDSDVDPAQRLMPPGFDQDGASFRIALSEPYVLRSPASDALHAMIDANEDGASLADDDAVSALASEFDARGVVYGQLSSETASLSWGEQQWEQRLEFPEVPDTEEMYVADAGIPLLSPYQTAGAGLVIDGEETSAIYVLIHEDASTAEDNVEAIEERLDALDDRGLLTEAIPHDQDIQVSSDGRAVIVELAGAGMVAHPQMTLFLHEE